MRLTRAHLWIAPVAAAVLCAAATRAARSTDELLELATPAPAFALDPPTVVDLESVACAECHRAVAEEWAATAHGLAWVDRVYQTKIAERKRPELCAGCHVPQPLLADGELVRRAKARDDASEPRVHGITCQSCHAGPAGAVLGPRGEETEAHATLASPYMTPAKSSELCAVCHRTNIGPVVGIAKDFPGSRAEQAGGSCVGCHMAPVERAWADGEGVAPRRGRSHAIQTPRDPAFLAQAFDLTYRVQEGSTTVVVANRAGHRVPGLIGREIRFRASARAAGAELASAELVIDTKAYLPVDGELEIQLDGAADEVRVVGEHIDPRHPDPVVFHQGPIPRADASPGGAAGGR